MCVCVHGGQVWGLAPDGGAFRVHRRWFFLQSFRDAERNVVVGSRALSSSSCAVSQTARTLRVYPPCFFFFFHLVSLVDCTRSFFLVFFDAVQSSIV